VKSDHWYLYVLLCSDGSYYTGVTVDVDRRLKEHNASKAGAKYTRSRRPVELLFYEKFQTRSTAQKAEYHFKKLTRKQKEKLINEHR
jgi:putative endonuclease